MNIKLGMNKAITVVIGGGLAGLAAAGALSELEKALSFALLAAK